MSNSSDKCLVYKRTACMIDVEMPRICMNVHMVVVVVNRKLADFFHLSLFPVIPW